MDSTLFLTDAAGRLAALERPSAQAGATFRYDGRDYLLLADSEALSFRDSFETGDVCAWSGTIGLFSVPVCTIRPAVRSIYNSEGLLHSLHRNVAPQSSYLFHFAGRPVAQLDISSGTESWKWLTADHLGTPIAATSAGGAMLWQGGFEPFGADWSGAGGAGVFLRFPGQWVEGVWGASGEGLYYNVHRWYGWGTGRYTRPDPLGLMEGDPHSYAYVYDNPVKLIDPLGLRTPIIGAGKFCTGESCSCKIPLMVLGEDKHSLVAVPALGQCLDADGVYTPEGILKIPDNYRCTFECNDQGQPKAPSVIQSIRCSARPWIPGKKPELYQPGQRLPEGWPSNPLGKK